MLCWSRSHRTEPQGKVPDGHGAGGWRCVWVSGFGFRVSVCLLDVCVWLQGMTEDGRELYLGNFTDWRVYLLTIPQGHAGYTYVRTLMP